MKIHSRHLRLISMYWTRYAIRGGAGIVYLLLALMFALIIAHIFEQQHQYLQDNPAMNPEMAVEIDRSAIQWVLDIDPEENPSANSVNYGIPEPDPWTAYLLDDRPALLSKIFLVMLFGMPFMISVLGFNQTAGDIQSRGLRYLMLRTERANIYFGRFLGSALFSTLVTAFLVATITFYVGMKFRIYSTASLTIWGLYGFGAISILMLPYLAVCSAISASVSSPFLSLAASKLIIIGVPIASMIGKHNWEPLENIKYLLPWGIQNYLMHPEWTHFLGAAAGCLGYTLGFLLLGYVRFQRRDL